MPEVLSVDGYRFVGRAAARVMRAWCRREPAATDSPWTPLARPLATARVALLSSAGVVRKDDLPFDQDGERRDPWWGDPTHRAIPRATTADQVRIDHLHIDPRPAARDLDCILPLRRLDELVAKGIVGASAEHHYSIMGYLLRPARLLADTVPRVAAALASEQVDLVLMAPV